MERPTGADLTPKLDYAHARPPAPVEVEHGCMLGCVGAAYGAALLLFLAALGTILWLRWSD